MTESLTDLPPNILIEILSRLPLKTIFACRCTCKTICNLISHHNPFFIAAHSLNASQMVILQFNNRVSRLLRFIEPKYDFRPGFEGNWSQNNMFGSSDPRSIYGEIRKLSMVNSCNGLLYFVRRDFTREASIVCNPFTSEYVVIPEIDSERRRMIFGMWLGFCPLSNKYKVLRISTTPGHLRLDAQVHMVGSDSWMDVQCDLGSFKYPWDAPNVVLDGFIYWLDRCSPGAIVYFDFEEENFGVISLPDEFYEEQLHNEALGIMIHSGATIGLLDGSFCFSYNDHYAVHVWVRKRDGNQEIWRKQFVVYFDPRHCLGSGGKFQPLQVLTHGEILMLYLNQHLVCFDPMNHSIRTVMTPHQSFVESVVTLKPSFIPLKNSLMVDDGIVKRLR